MNLIRVISVSEKKRGKAGRMEEKEGLQERKEGRKEERVRWERYEGRVKEKKKEHIEGTCHCQ